MHDGRVLVDETGALPSFVPSQHLGSLTSALSLVGASVAVAPVAKLPAGRRLHLVGLRAAAPAGRSVAVSNCPTPHWPRLAPIVDLVFQAITFDDIVNTTEP